MKFFKMFFLGLCVGIFSPHAAFSESIYSHISPDFLKNPLWDDGNSEVSVYEAEEMRYGVKRKAEAVMIFVKESHKPSLLVKADDWREKGLLNVMKFNYVLTVPTGIYTYRQMASVFFDKGDFNPVKLTVGSQEWCGNSFKEIVNFKGSSFINYVTYWDNQGSGRKDLNLEKGALFYDSLPMLLRALVMEKGEKVQVRLIPGQISSKLTPYQPEEASITFLGEEGLDGPSGMISARRFLVTHSKGGDLFWFSSEFPHVMIKWKRSDGTVYRLRKSFRLDYWNKTAPGDEKYRDRN